MSLSEGFMSRVVDAVAEKAHESTRQQNPGLPFAAWAAMTPAQRFPVLELTSDYLSPIWPLVEKMVDDEVAVHAGILRARVEMFIDELRGRGLGESANVAGELEQIINAPMED